jgi:hypothetical protein
VCFPISCPSPLLIPSLPSCARASCAIRGALPFLLYPLAPLLPLPVFALALVVLLSPSSPSSHSPSHPLTVRSGCLPSRCCSRLPLLAVPSRPRGLCPSAIVFCALVALAFTLSLSSLSFSPAFSLLTQTFCLCAGSLIAVDWLFYSGSTAAQAHGLTGKKTPKTVVVGPWLPAEWPLLAPMAKARLQAQKGNTNTGTKGMGKEAVVKLSLFEESSGWSWRIRTRRLNQSRRTWHVEQKYAMHLTLHTQES